MYSTDPERDKEEIMRVMEELIELAKKDESAVECLEEIRLLLSEYSDYRKEAAAHA